MNGLLSSLFMQPQFGDAGAYDQMAMPPNQSSLAEAMSPDVGLNLPELIMEYLSMMQSQEPMSTTPGEDFLKKNKRAAMLQAGAGMLSAPDLLSGIGAAASGYGSARDQGVRQEEARLMRLAQQQQMGDYRKTMGLSSLLSRLPDPEEAGPDTQSLLEAGKMMLPQEQWAEFEALVEAYPEKAGQWLKENLEKPYTLPTDEELKGTEMTAAARTRGAVSENPNYGVTNIYTEGGGQQRWLTERGVPIRPIGEEKPPPQSGPPIPASKMAYNDEEFLEMSTSRYADRNYKAFIISTILPDLGGDIATAETVQAIQDTPQLNAIVDEWLRAIGIIPEGTLVTPSERAGYVGYALELRAAGKMQQQQERERQRVVPVTDEEIESF